MRDSEGARQLAVPPAGARSRVPSSDPAYRNALFHLLTSETSCCRYWGEGVWTAYGAELARGTREIVVPDV